MRMKTTQIRLDTETAQTLRDISAALGYYITRGVGAGNIGNISGLLEELARQYKGDPDTILDALNHLHR